MKRKQPPEDDLEECRRVRREIRARFATFDEYFDYLRELDRKRLAADPQKRKGIAKVRHFKGDKISKRGVSATINLKRAEVPQDRRKRKAV